MSRGARTFSTKLLVFLWFAGLLMGQTQQGDIIGTVRDATGGVVPGAEVTITNESTGAVRTMQTNIQGEYTALGFFPGVYRVETAMKGFQRAEIPGVRVEPQSKVRVDVSLRLGEVSDKVTVTAPTVTLEGSTVTTSMPRVFFERNLTVDDAAGPALQQAMWFAGSSATQGQLWGGVLNRDRHVEYQLEGSQTIDFVLPPRSREEATIVMGSPAAEYGRPVTANVTQRSGTNQLHGEYVPNFVNPAVNAVNVNTGPRVRPVGLTQWRHDFNVGGPVYIPKIYDGRNKTFFFFDHYKTRATPDIQLLNVTVPTQRMLGGDFSRYVDSRGALIPVRDPFGNAPFPGNVIPSNRLSSVSSNVVKDVIVDNFGNPGRYVGGPDNLLRNAEYPCTSQTSYWAKVLKIDQNISSKHVISGSWNNADRFFYKCGIGMPGFNRFSDLPQNRYNIGHTWIVTSRVTNQLRVAYSSLNETQFTPKTYQDRTPILGADLAKRWGLEGIPNNGRSGGPKMNITSGVDVFLNHNTEQQERHDRRFQIYENLSYVTGKHTVKGGAMTIRHKDVRIHNPSDAFGSFTFDGRFSGVPFSDFLLGIPNVSSRAQSRSDIDQRITEVAAYIQDDWRLTRKLTVSLGIRWDRFSAPFDANGLYFNFDPASGKMVVPSQKALDRVSSLWPTSTLPVVLANSLNFPEKLTGPTHRFLPRLSLAYRPSAASDLVIRGGFGIYNSLYRFEGLQTAGPFALGEVVQNELVPGTGGGSVPRFTFPNPFGAAAGRAAGVATGSSVSPNLRPEYITTWNVSVEKSLIAGTVMRLSYMGNRGSQLIHSFDMNTPLVSAQPFAQSRRPYPAYQSITRIENGENSRYNTMQVSLARRWSNGLHLDVTYIRQRGYATYTSYAWDRKRDRGIDNQWPLHDFLTNFAYELPFGAGKRWLANASGAKWALARVVGGWSATGVFSWHSGHRSTPTFSGYDSGNINQFSGRPDLVPGCDLYTRPNHIVNGQAWVNGACFKAPAPGTLGNAPVNLLEGPGQWVLNASPFKDFRIPKWETARLRIGASIYNVLNSSSYWTAPNGNMGAFTRQADGSLALRPPTNPFSLGASWVRRVGTEGTSQRKWWFQATFMF